VSLFFGFPIIHPFIGQTRIDEFEGLKACRRSKYVPGLIQNTYRRKYDCSLKANNDGPNKGKAKVFKHFPPLSQVPTPFFIVIYDFSASDVSITI
jgi:hypothetical protein